MREYKIFFYILFFIPTITFSKAVFIIHKKNKLESISRLELMRIFTLRQKNWSDGELIKVFNLTPRSEVRDFLFKKYFNKSSLDLQKYYIRLSLTSMGLPPIEVDSEDEILRKIKNNVGAIGYISKEKLTSDVRELSVKD